MYYNIIALKLAYYWSDSAMVRLDPISPRMVRSISFYVQIVREVELTIAIHFRAKQRYARVTVATHGAMTPENTVRNPIVCDTPISEKKFERYLTALQIIDVEAWREQYAQVSGGNAWHFRMELTDGRVIFSQGCGDYPEEWSEMMDLHEQLCPFWHCFVKGRVMPSLGFFAKCG